MDAFLKALGARIRELRKAAKLSQEQLAAAAGLTAKYVSQVETGQANASIKVLHAVAEEGLDVSLGALFNFTLSRDEARALGDEIARLLAAQPIRERRRALRVLQALTLDG